MPSFLNLDGLALKTDQGKWKRTAEAVARDVLRPNAEKVDREGCFPVENIRALGKAGLLGLLVPKELGGPGGNIVTAVVVTEAIAKGCAATAMAYHMHQTTVPTMCAAAMPNQVDKFIAPIVRGEWLGAFAMSEPGSGNKIWHMDSYARRDGDDYIIDSFKSFCTSAGFADFYLVPTRADADSTSNDLSLFFIPGTDENIKPIGTWDGMGLSVRTLAITAKPNASPAGASSQNSSPPASMSCRTSTALRTTTGLILEFFLRVLFGPNRPVAGFTPPPGLVPASICPWR
jgi:alkylation response protein AidB-like acyl-CoA dehydrogenase